VKVGNFHYIVRVGPATLSEAQKFCADETPLPMVLYKPSYESIHNFIYKEVLKYGATTFWTQAQQNGDGEMVWM
jgi:hypothetical protein